MKKFILLILVLSLPISLFAKIVDTGTGTITKVTDGDTIKVLVEGKEQTIRLLGVDTPEKYATRFGYAECYGEEASKYVSSLLPLGTTVYIEFHGSDKYSRDLADMYIGNSNTGTLIAKSIIQDGYGWVYRTGIKSNNYSGLVKSEENSKKLKNGLWKNNTCGGKRIKAESKSTTTVVVKKQTNSRVYYTGEKGGCYYLNSSKKKTYVEHSYCAK